MQKIKISLILVLIIISVSGINAQRRNGDPRGVLLKQQAGLIPILPIPWTDVASKSEIPLPEYPHPQRLGYEWLNLNGVWDYLGGKDKPAVVTASEPPSFNTDVEIIPVKYSFLELISDIPEFINIINRSFVSISITEILRDYIIDKELVNSYKKRLALLTEEEAIVLNTIRQDDLKSVIIKFDTDNKLNFLEEVKESKVDKAARLAELIMAKGYQDITIKTQDGNIVYCENKKKTMIQIKE